MLWFIGVGFINLDEPIGLSSTNLKKQIYFVNPVPNDIGICCCREGEVEECIIKLVIDTS